MKKYKSYLIVFLALAITILIVKIDYNKSFTNYMGLYDETISPSERNVEIYIVAFDALIQEDKGLNSGMKYISIDSNITNDLTEEEKKVLLSYFTKYNVEVKNLSFEELRNKGMFDENTHSLEGILLEVKDIKKKTDKEVIIEATKYRSGLGAIGMEYTLKYIDGRWEMKSSKMLWIS